MLQKTRNAYRQNTAKPTHGERRSDAACFAERLVDPLLTARVLQRIRDGNDEADPLRRLTPQERQLLEGIGEGLTNRQIAERMFLAEKTVKNYVSQLLGKLGMRRRSEVAAFAARLDERRARPPRY